MERKRGILACIFMSAAILALTLSAYATNGDSSADMKTVSSPIYRLVIPVGQNGAFDFTIDPYGLTLIGESGSTLDKLLENDPPGLVTSDALTIENKFVTDVAVTIKASFSMPPNVNISLAKSEKEARDGRADLYLKMSSANFSGTGQTVPFMVFSENGQTEEKEFTLEGAGVGKNSVCDFVIDGYANPNSEVWAVMPSQGMSIEVTYSFRYINEEEPSTEESSSEESSSEESSSEEQSSDEQSSDETPTESSSEEQSSEETTTPPVINDVLYDPNTNSFGFSIDKTDISTKPTKVCMIYNNTYYDLSMFGQVVIEDTGNGYSVSVIGFSGTTGTYPLVLYSGNKVIYDKATITFP